MLGILMYSSGSSKNVLSSVIIWVSAGSGFFKISIKFFKLIDMYFLKFPLSSLANLRYIERRVLFSF